jgi:hypothetical protein
MRRQGWMLALAGALVLASARGALAVWTEYQIKNKSETPSDRALTVTSKPDSAMTRIDVTVESKSPDHPISPFAHSNLSVYDGDRLTAEVPVRPYWTGDTLHFSFKVSSHSMDNTHFEIQEQGWTYRHDARGKVLKDRNGKPEAEETLGGQAYWFFLKDLVEAEKG